MSRLTSAQIISQGEYLEPDFDPASLTVSQLLGVLGYHNVNYPTPYNKPKLLKLFDAEIKTRSSKFKKERLKKANSIASDDGITDGVTGRPLSSSNQNISVRRSSRRLSHPPAEEDTVVVPSNPPKRRRPSTQPVPGASQKAGPFPSTLAEESEPEEVQLLLKSKKNSQHRRVSQPAEDSGWEDNNIFQSGAESSSPVRPSPTRPKPSKKNMGPRKSTKPTSTVVQLEDASPSRVTSAEEKSYQPSTPPRGQLPPKPVTVEQNSSAINQAIWESQQERDQQNELMKGQGVENIAEDASSIDLEHESEHNLAMSAPIPEGSNAVESVSRSNTRLNFASIFRRGLLLLSVLSIATACVNYKNESATIGFCDRGSNTSVALQNLRDNRKAIDLCNRENRTTLFPPVQKPNQGETASSAEPCPLPPLIPFPHPNSCTPCPESATCSQYNVLCDTGYLLRAHPLFFYLPPSSSPSESSSSSLVDSIWKIISLFADGLPGLGSIAFPPRCVEDPKRKRHIGSLGKAVEAVLGQERGKRLCQGGKYLKEAIPEDGGGDAKKWGVDVEKLRAVMKAKTSPQLLHVFDDTFNEAIQQLIQWGGVLIGEDEEGHRYLAHKTPSMTWDCSLTVKARNVWAEWRTSVLTTIAGILGALGIRFRIIKKQLENKRVSELVQIALDTLRNQEIAHHTDPVIEPQPYLSSLQLRDLILQDEHSIPTRRRLWDQVERVVEGNANVRANLEEIEGGDETRVWRWVGTTGRGSGARK